MGEITPRVLTLRTSKQILLRSPGREDATSLLEFGLHAARTAPFNVTQPDEFDQDIAKERTWIDDHLQKPGYVAIMAQEVLADHAIASALRLPTAAPPAVVGPEAPAGAITAPVVIGMLNFRNHSRRRMAHHGHFGITVHHDWRGMGIGRHLISTLLEWARASPIIEKVCLGVFATNLRAQKLYASLGFVEEGRRPREFKLEDGTYIDDVQMSQWVK